MLQHILNRPRTIGEMQIGAFKKIQNIDQKHFVFLQTIYFLTQR